MVVDECILLCEWSYNDNYRGRGGSVRGRVAGADKEYY